MFRHLQNKSLNIRENDISFLFVSVQTTDDVEWTCDVNRCQNGGTCKKGRAQCVCRLGYVGRFCECKFINLKTLWFNELVIM